MIGHCTRRLLAIVLLLMSAAAPALAIEVDGQEVSVAGPEVQEYLEAVFPQQYEALGGLFTLTARDPVLTIPVTGQRLQMTFSASASSPGRGSVPAARISVSSGLRYDPVRYAVFLDQPSIEDVRPAGDGPGVDEQTRMLLSLWLAEYAREEPLYRLEPEMVAMLGSINVESTRIEDQRIVVRFNQPLGWSGASPE